MSSSKDYDSMTSEEKEVFDKAAREKEAQEQALLPYRWTQNLGDVDISIDVPKGTRARDLVVEIKKKSLKAGLKGQTPIIDGLLSKEIKMDDSTWSLDDGKELNIHLEKYRGTEWWKCVIEGHAEVDTSKIVPENSKLSELDGDTRGMVEKMMQKAKGLPSSDEIKKQETFERFKAMHPELDF
ncbi:hypothetical protein BGW38_003992, partial [Lunasporangiospora selenospora]